MSSPSRCCARGMSNIPSLHLLPFLLSLLSGVQGATLREHRLSGSEPGFYEAGSQLRPPPSAEMLRALRYIQSLSQQTPSEPPVDGRQPATADREPDDMESVRSMLQLSASARSSTGMDRGLEEREDGNDNTQQWLQAVLTTLQQTEEQMVPQKTPQKMSQKVTAHTLSPPRPRYAVQPLPVPKQQLEVKTSNAENYERTSWGNPGSRRRHRQYPLIFEEEEDQEQPLKRTNENAEEQYTPQKLATLQSVFEELSGISTSKTNSKRESVVATTDDEDEDEDDDDDLYRQRKMALEDIMGTDEWDPLEEKIETEEEQRERHGYNSNPEDEDDDEEVKRSNQPDLFREDPENIAKLMDYYLLKVLEKKEQEQQKREEANDRDQEEEETDREVEKKDEDEEEEEERNEEEREIKPARTAFPQSLSQLIKISQKLQMPPQDVLDLLQNEPRNFRIPPRTPAQSRTASRAYTATPDAHQAYAAAPHRRPLQTPEGNSVAQDILSILELVSAAQLHDRLPPRPSPPKPSRYYERERDLPEYGFPDTGRDDYDDTAGEDDELAGFLASEMLAQRQRRARPEPSELKRAVQDYLDSSEKRPAEHKSATTSSDEERMLKLLQYLDPDSDDPGDTDSEGKSIPEM